MSIIARKRTTLPAHMLLVMPVDAGRVDGWNVDVAVVPDDRKHTNDRVFQNVHCAKTAQWRHISQ